MNTDFGILHHFLAVFLLIKSGNAALKALFATTSTNSYSQCATKKNKVSFLFKIITFFSPLFSDMTLITCERCNFVTTMRHYNEHCVRAHNRCVSCLTDFDSFGDVIAHMASVHDEKISCQFCDFLDYPASCVLRHEMNTHLSCSQCQITFSSLELSRKHYKSKHSVKSPKLPKKAKMEAKVAEKSQSSNTVPRTVYQCDQCDFASTNPITVRRHARKRRYVLKTLNSG